MLLVDGPTRKGTQFCVVALPNNLKDRSSKKNLKDRKLMLDYIKPLQNNVRDSCFINSLLSLSLSYTH
jgi:hypothetical protein